jgi:hypothetical protein
MFILPRPTRRAHWHLRHTPGPTLTGVLRCGNEQHTVSWRWGRLHFDQHRAAALAFEEALGGVPCGCAKVLAAVRDSRYYAADIPGPIRNALIAWDEQLRERHLSRSVHLPSHSTLLRQRLRRDAFFHWVHPLVDALTRAGLKVLPKVEIPDDLTVYPTIQLCAPGTGDALAEYTRGSWHRHETVIDNTASRANMPAWSRPSQRNTFCFSAQRCRLCQLPMTELTARDAHAESPEHRAHAQTTMARILGATASLMPPSQPIGPARPVIWPPTRITLER